MLQFTNDILEGQTSYHNPVQIRFEPSNFSHIKRLPHLLGIWTHRELIIKRCIFVLMKLSGIWSSRFLILFDPIYFLGQV